MVSPTTRFRPSWFCRDELEHQRFLDMHARLLPVNAKVLVVVLVAIIPALAQPEKNLVAAVPALLGVALFGVLQRVAMRFSHPQEVTFVALLGAVTCIVIALYVYDAADSPALALVVWPVSGVAGRYPRRVLTVFVAYAVTIAVGALLLASPGDLTATPLHFTILATAIIAAASVNAVLRDSDIDNRGAAIIDQLTGMLNRNALQNRIPEIAEQSRLTAQPVGVIVADLDHFKAVNDTYGHTTGDAVLRDVAYVLRRELRAYDLAYRLGGEEFVILLPGAALEETGEMAERLRRAVGSEQIQGLDIRVSLGAAATQPGEAFDWASLFEQADAALYDAKRAGRDRVVVAGSAELDQRLAIGT